mgnify:CR=1 FL=1
MMTFEYKNVTLLVSLVCDLLNSQVTFLEFLMASSDAWNHGAAEFVTIGYYWTEGSIKFQVSPLCFVLFEKLTSI